MADSPEEQPLPQQETAEQLPGHIDVQFHEGQSPEAIAVGSPATEIESEATDMQEGTDHPISDEATESKSADDESDTKSQVVEDVDKAWDMAHSAKEERDSIAKVRGHVRDDAELLPQVEDFFASEQDMTPEEAEKTRQALIKKIDSVTVMGDGRRDQVTEARNALRYGDKLKGTRGQREASFAEWQEKRADYIAEKDSLADKIEKWAGILHEHPLPESFIESEQITARGLVAIEEQVTNAEEAISEHAQRVEELDLLDGVKGIRLNSRVLDPLDLIVLQSGNGHYTDRGVGQANIDALRNAINSSDKKFERFMEHEVMSDYVTAEFVDKVKAFRDVINNPDTTLGQLRDMYKENYTKVFIEPNRKFVEKNKALLDQIRSGNASDPNNDASS